MAADSHAGVGRGQVPGGGSAPEHRFAVRAILSLATVLAVLAIFSIWANRQLMNPPSWARTSTQLLQKQTIRAAVSTYLVNQLFANADVESQLASALPAELRSLAAPVSGVLRGTAEQGAERALASAQVQQIWRNANLRADEALVAVVNGHGPGFQIRRGTVSLNLRPIVIELAERIGLPASIAQQLPSSVARLRVIDSEQLGLVRNLAKALHALALWLTIIVIALYALALFLAHGRRLRTLMWAGVSLALAGVIVLIGRGVAEGRLISAVTKDPSIEPAARDAYTVATSLLVHVAVAAVAIGVPLLLLAWLLLRLRSGRGELRREPAGSGRA